MTDEELIAHLRLQGLDKDIAAADRIEQLVIEANETHEEAMESIAMWGAALKGQRAAEAKLARAIETLQFYVDTKRSARASLDAILAELEKTE